MNHPCYFLQYLITEELDLSLSRCDFKMRGNCSHRCGPEMNSMCQHCQLLLLLSLQFLLSRFDLISIFIAVYLNNTSFGAVTLSPS